MRWDIGMPNLGHTAESGTVQEWHRAPGDRIGKGDIVLTVESDKVAIDVEAPADGFLRAILHAAGSEVAIGTTLGVLTTTADEAWAAPDTATAQTATSPAAAPGPTAPTAAPPPAAAHPAQPRLRSTPLARRMVEAAGLSLQDVARATGADPIRKRDVEAVLAARTPAPAPAPAPAVAGARRAIARQVTQGWSVPTVRLVRDLEAGALARSARAAGVTLTAALLWHLAGALRRHPAVAAHWVGDGPVPQPAGLINVAVDTPRGVMMPLLDADEAEGLAGLAEALRAAADAARSGRAPGAPGGFTLSSLGGMGIDQFDPILYAPQVATLGLGRLHRTLHLTETGIEMREVMTATLVIDHRALDGADGARFLADLQAAIDAVP